MLAWGGREGRREGAQKLPPHNSTVSQNSPLCLQWRYIILSRIMKYKQTFPGDRRLFLSAEEVSAFGGSPLRNPDPSARYLVRGESYFSDIFVFIFLGSYEPHDWQKIRLTSYVSVNDLNKFTMYGRQKRTRNMPRSVSFDESANGLYSTAA